MSKAEKRHHSGNPLRILIVTPAYKPAFVYGGPIRSITELCEKLSQQGMDVAVLTTTANGSEELDVETNHSHQIEGVSVIHFRRWSGDHTHFSPGLLLSVFRQCKQYDVVHIQSWWNLVSVFASCICLVRGIKPIIALRGTLSAHSFSHNHTAGKKLFHAVLGRYILKKCLLHTTSSKESEEVKKMVPNAKRHLLPNLLALPDKIYEPSREQSGIFHLLFVGRIHPIKNLELLFETLRQLKGSLKWKLSIVGDGDASYVNLLKDHTSEFSQIDWLGEVDGEKKYLLMAQADLLVLLSHSENFGNVVIEALSQGTPVLVSKYVGVSEYVLEKRLGWVIDTNVQECLNAMQEIVQDKNTRESIRIKASKCIVSDYSAESLISKYISMYHMVSTRFQTNNIELSTIR